MGNNNGEPLPYHSDQRHYQQQRPTNSGHSNLQPQRQRSGLLPTDVRESYKRSSTRASERSRAERISYLMATGHLDPEETERLNKPSTANESLISTVPAYQRSSNSPSRFRLSSASSSSGNNNEEQLDDSSEPISSQQPKSLKVNTKRSCFEQSYLDELNRTLANSPKISSNNLLQPHHNEHDNHFKQQENIFGSTLKNKKKCNNNNSGKKSKRNSENRSRSGFIQHSHSQPQDNSNSRPTFRQTYTEVTLPMKTSPAFEYILKDNRRRNKRCCLWFLYSTLVTICLALLAFSTVHLLLRASRSNT